MNKKDLSSLLQLLQESISIQHFIKLSIKKNAEICYFKLLIYKNNNAIQKKNVKFIIYITNRKNTITNI